MSLLTIEMMTVPFADSSSGIQFTVIDLFPFNLFFPLIKKKINHTDVFKFCVKMKPIKGADSGFKALNIIFHLSFLWNSSAFT